MTWENPLAPSSSSTPAPGSSSATPGPSRPVGGLPDIDPDLAYLLPSESRDAAGNQLLAVSGRFQQRDDGAFAARDEYERQKRFGDAYFDVEGWERERGKRRREEEQPKKVTKKDMVSLPKGPADAGREAALVAELSLVETFVAESLAARRVSRRLRSLHSPCCATLTRRNASRPRRPRRRAAPAHGCTTRHNAIIVLLYSHLSWTDELTN